MSVNAGKKRKTIKTKSDLRVIGDFMQRRITLSKRRRGLVKKAIELANICDQQIYVALYDSQYNTVVQFQTSEQFGLNEVVEHVVTAQQQASNPELYHS